MSDSKKTVALKATSITFHKYTIEYGVEFVGDHSPDIIGVPFCDSTIKNKELVLIPTLISKDSMEVIFTTSNVIPHFYQSILDKTLFDIEEYSVEINNIYLKGDIVGYVLI
mgnify:CR=1 FL=1|tara:strand:- start:1893 stop:2225 length:333 start_codon:yes stop_codon:yes gene_type:complete